jgi:ferredoxin
MQLAPYIEKDKARFSDDDCIKCGICVAACPKKVLTFEPREKKVATKTKSANTARKDRVGKEAA